MPSRRSLRSASARLLFSEHPGLLQRLPYLFERFDRRRLHRVLMKSARNAHQRSILLLHGAQFGVKSRVGEGTLVRITIPKEVERDASHNSG